MRTNQELSRLLASAPRRTVTRREVLRRLGAGAGGISMAAFLAACGVEGEAESNKSSGATDKLTTTKKNGELNFANWPLYIDPGKKGTLADFEKKSGIDVQYKDVINDNLEFYATIREPLASDQATQWDIIVVTDWLINKMASLGYIETLDHSRLPNFDANAAEIHKDPSYDPDNAHSVPWQSGITGIAYNTDITGGDITSIEDLFNPEFKGKVGMMTEMRDTMSLTMLGMGVKPEEATVEDARAAQEKLIEQRDSGILRSYNGNNYVQQLAGGDLGLCMAWSGDVIGKTLGGSASIKFTVPQEGGMLFTDCMAIPQDAANPIDAMAMMNFVYQPDIAAQMVAWINYISPVPQAQEILSKADDAYSRQVAASPLVFPTPEMEQSLYNYKNLDPQEEEEWNDLFNEVLAG